MNNKILGDHKKTGKIFQPPLLAMGTFVETGWLDYSVPEFIWILLLIEEYGVEEGSIIFLEFCNIADQYINPKVTNGSAATMMSFYSLLSNEEKNDLLVKMKNKSLLPKFVNALYPFLKLYPECPFSFLNKMKKNEKIPDNYIVNYKIRLSKILDKTTFESSILMANVINFLISVDRISVVQDSKTPHLKEILNYPNTEDSKRLASFLRSTISMCYNVEWGYDRNNTWIKYFWNQGIKIEPSKL